MTLNLVQIAGIGLLAFAGVATAQSLNYDVYKTKVEPIFLKKRPSHARCVVCHAGAGNAFRLERLAQGATNWTDEQSRKNFEVVSKLINASDVPDSPILKHPLAPEGGGDDFHSGGRQFKSKNDAEWKIIYEWASAAKK
jgi:hypothetical protein